MQRDVYAAMIKKRHKQMVPLLIHQVSGDITRENIFDEVFSGYKLRRIVLMTHMAATPATQPRLPHDVIVSDFETLKKVHQPHFHYKLLPLLCTDIEAFAAMQGICASAHSPFVIEDRRDPQGLTHRLSNGCAERQALCDFFEQHIPAAERQVPVFSRKLPISAILFDGLLFRRSSTSCSNTHEHSATGTSRANMGCSLAALVTVHESITEKAIRERTLMRDLFHSPLYTKLGCNTDVAQALRLVPDCKHFMAVKRAVGSDGGSRFTLLQCAAEKGVHIYEKIGDVYKFAHK
ncbi:hypothetical protein TRVL_04525 [Trypanosoma vivax]|uniref:Uncharacterized protein n=1 Tax=Trypanosoma vivax (strain Y486) TaxID=1055687 RepID=G0TR61_TRYVY|nr:hypothetical protein TRVL_04525 [Trypanosoma vivax]CCC46425.1 conserved hypothetical protein [Trypanosoma vivax Y486]